MNITEIMMKKFLGLVVVLAALVLGGYYGMGLITERTLEKNIEIINQTNGVFVDIENYHRGWYTSTAVLNWRLHTPERLSKNSNGESTTIAAQDYKIQMPITIYHGPIIYSDTGIRFGLGYVRSDVVMPQEYAEKFSNMFTAESTKPQVSFSVFVNYLNNSNLHIDIPAFKLISKQGGDQFEWNGMRSHLSASSNLRDINGGFAIDGAGMTKNKVNITLGKLISNYNLHQTDEGIYLGSASLTLPSFVVTENAQKILDVEQFTLSSSSDINSGLFNSQFTTSLNKVTAHERVYGPARLEMSIKNIDAQALAELNTAANKIQQGAEAERQQALLAMIPVLPKLFGKGAQFEVSTFSLVVPEGTIEGNLLVSLPKGDTGNPFQLLQKVVGHGTLKVPAMMLKGLMVVSAKQKLLSQPTLQQAMVQQMKTNDSAQEKIGETPNSPAQDNQVQNKPLAAVDVEQQATAQADQELSNMVNTGLIVLQGTEYVIDVNLAQGQLSVNGKPFTPAMMQF
jgi:uncharacterized protein YdgA (DUF945 family)